MVKVPTVYFLLTNYNENDIEALKASQGEDLDSFYDEEYYAQTYKSTESKISVRTNKIDNNTIKSTVTMSGDGYEKTEDSSRSSW